jgi:hypothetical protein
MSKRNVTPETIAKWREAALKNQPWKRSTGPKTAEGKAQAARNGKTRQRGRHSYRELFAMAKARRLELRAEAAFRKDAAKSRAAERRPTSGRPTKPAGRPGTAASPDCGRDLTKATSDS